MSDSRLPHMNSEDEEGAIHKHPNVNMIGDVQREFLETGIDKKILISSIFVQDACNGHYGLSYKTDEESIKAYIRFNSQAVKYVLHFVILFHLSLAIFESPAVDGFHLPFWATMTMESICLIFYLAHLLYALSFCERKLFWMDPKNITLLVLIIAIMIDIFCFASFSVRGIHTVRWSRPIRPLFLVNFLEFRQVRRAFRNIWRTMPDIINVLVLLFLTIGLFALMAIKLFGKRKLLDKSNRPYFQNFLDSFFDLYVLVTAANNPDIMIPAYNSEKLSVLFFIAFITICLFIIMNILLAVVYNSYRKNLKNEIRMCIYLKRQLLSKAYNLLKTEINEEKFVEKSTFSHLIKKIKPKSSETYTNILWQVLDGKGKNKIGEGEFLQLADLLNVEISEVKDRENIFSLFIPRMYNSKISRKMRGMVRTKYFRYFFDAIITVNAIFIALDLNFAEWFFLSAFTLEILMKMYSFGVREFFKRFWNVFDFIVIGSALTWGIADTFYEQGANSKNHLEFLMVLRVLRLIKIIGAIPRFKIIITTIMHLGPSIVTYGCVLLVFQYMFAVIGMELFGGLLKRNKGSDNTFCNNDKLKDSDFWKADYCNLNFNNILQAMIVMFELTVVNQWHVITMGYARVSSQWARLYFMVFHIVCVLIVLSIFTAFVLEAFILEFNLSKRWHENILERKINELGLGLGSKPCQLLGVKVDKLHLINNLDEDSLDSDHNFRQLDPSHYLEEKYPNLGDETDLRFHLSTGPKNVEDILQRMFESEMDEKRINELDV